MLWIILHSFWRYSKKSINNTTKKKERERERTGNKFHSCCPRQDLPSGLNSFPLIYSHVALASRSCFNIAIINSKREERFSVHCSSCLPYQPQDGPWTRWFSSRRTVRKNYKQKKRTVKWIDQKRCWRNRLVQVLRCAYRTNAFTRAFRIWKPYTLSFKIGRNCLNLPSFFSPSNYI